MEEKKLVVKKMKQLTVQLNICPRNDLLKKFFNAKVDFISNDF